MVGQWLVADFPLQGTIRVILFLEDLFPFYPEKVESGKNLPFTVAGQQWIFTIFPSC